MHLTEHFLEMFMTLEYRVAFFILYIQFSGAWHFYIKNENNCILANSFNFFFFGEEFLELGSNTPLSGEMVSPHGISNVDFKALNTCCSLVLMGRSSKQN